MKRMLLILCFLMAAMSVCACAPVSQPEVATETHWSVTDDLVFSLEYEEYPVGVESMRMILSNQSDLTLMYGQGWAFERYEKGEWVPVPVKENTGFTSEGYILSERSQDTFNISTWFLKEPLKEGTYHVTGCKLYVESDESSNTEYPAYQFIFRVSKDATAPMAASEDPLPREDWEWMTTGEIVSIYKGETQSIWQFVKGNDGLMALLYRDNTPENEILNQGDLLKLDLFDRKSGERYPVYTEPAVETDQVQPVDSGFRIRFYDGSEILTEITEGELILTPEN